MKPTTLTAVVALLVLSSCFPAPAHCRRSQADELKNLMKAKLTSNQFDRSPFKPVQYEKIASRLHVTDDQQATATSKDGDLIVRLPGQPPVSFKQYGGYVNVDPVNDRNMYYYFAEAQHPNKDQLPLVLWLNGGPGCSSLGYGAMTEQGPFRVASDGKSLYINKYSWNRVVNLLFVESPAGVGFSYSNTSSDYTTGDIKTAQDNFVFLYNWLQKFPEYKGRDFYIAGESYAGHYVPQLAQNIVLNRLKTLDNSINLKGIMIGNAIIHDETDILGMYDFFSNHGLASPETVAAALKHCNFSQEFTGNQTDECVGAADEVDASLENIYIYNIYVEECTSYTGPTMAPLPFSITEFDECSDKYVEHYLNQEGVQEAMHANTTKIPHRWSPCAGHLINYTQSSYSTLNEIRNMLDNNVTVMIYSGDMDGRVPFTSSQYSIKAMNLTVDTKFHPWYIAGQVGGYTETYKGGLTFATVRGAGHLVPSYQGLRGLSLFMHFIDGTPLPNSKIHE
ncbi:Serine carboxypeptidase-like 40 [Linum grandiflorum]